MENYRGERRNGKLFVYIEPVANHKTLILRNYGNREMNDTGAESPARNGKYL